MHLNDLKYFLSDNLIGSTVYSQYPDLLDVGAEELVSGLESGAWTSVDLTKVKFYSQHAQILH